MRGQIFNIDDKKIFTFGGARSHDISGGLLDPEEPGFKSKKKRLDKGYMPYRIKHLSWWEEEMPTEDCIFYDNILSYGHGNGRLCRNLIENAILEYAERNYGTDEEPNDDFILIDNDFVLPAYLQKKKETTPLGFVA